LAKTSKASLAKACHEAGIPVPVGADADTLRHRLRYWWAGKGWLFRLARPANRKGSHPVGLLTEWETVYWIPDSRMAKMIAESRLVFILGRTLTPPKDAKLLDIPKDFSKTWPIGENNDGEY